MNRADVKPGVPNRVFPLHHLSAQLADGETQSTGLPETCSALLVRKQLLYNPELLVCMEKVLTQFIQHLDFGL